MLVSADRSGNWDTVLNETAWLGIRCTAVCCHMLDPISPFSHYGRLASAYHLLVLSAGSSIIAKLIGYRQAKWASATQRRLTKTKTILSEMREIKIMGLEDKVQDLVQTERIRETKEMERFT